MNPGTQGGRTGGCTLQHKIGKFEVLGELGRGAMGTVFRARDPVLDREVAIKTISPRLLSDEDALARFQREARAAARLQHPNIVTVYELGQADGKYYIAMELLPGSDLASAMEVPTRLKPEDKLRIVAQVCDGLDFAHKNGVLHRDVKPANVRLLPDLSVKLVDFGIARLEDSNLTQTGLIMGTPSYIAPEVLTGQRPDHRSDLWAVGIVLYELLAKRRPFQAPTIATLVYQIVNQPAPLLDAAALGLPPAVTAVVERALAKNPGMRFQDLAEMKAGLLAAMGASRARAAGASQDQRARATAALSKLDEARRLMARGDHEAALRAARSGQALNPAHTDAAGLVDEIETALHSAPTIVSTPARPAERASFSELLKSRGAAAYREIATFGQPPATQTARAAPGRDVLAVAGGDGAVRLWDLGGRMCLHTLRTEMHRRTGHDALATCLAFAGDGRWLASGHVDGNVHLWDAASGEEIDAHMRHDAAVGALSFSPDGRVLASGGLDATVKLWDLGLILRGETRRELVRHPAAVTTACYLARGRLLVTGHPNRVVRVLDLKTGRLAATLRVPLGRISLLTPHPDERRLVVGADDRSLRVFDVDTRKELVTLPPQRRAAVAACFFPGGEFLATVCQENAVQLWDLKNGTLLAALWGEQSESFTGLAVYGRGERLAVALADGRVRVWGPAT